MRRTRGRWDTIDNRFFAKVHMTSGCWEWTAGKVQGYGQFNVGMKSVMAHRYSYERLIGPIPEGLQLDHLCRNTGCVRPEHLEPVTGRENLLRGETFQGKNARKTGCPRGHGPYTHRNTNGGRVCRTCQTENARACRERKKRREHGEVGRVVVTPEMCG